MQLHGKAQPVSEEKQTGKQSMPIQLTSLAIVCDAITDVSQHTLSQRSLHNAPIFRLLLKVAVNGTHQCDFLNFCGGLGPQHGYTALCRRRMYQNITQKSTWHN